MTSLWNKNATTYQSSAKVVDGNLILSLPDSINPVVWRMELGSVKASALEVKSQSPDGTFMLALKTPKGDVHDIAPFDSRERAVHALMRVSSALQSAEGKMAPSSTVSNNNSAAPASPRTSENNGSAWKWMIAVAGVVLVIFLFSYMSSLTPQSGEESPVPTATGTSGQASEESGVPESADKALQGF